MPAPTAGTTNLGQANNATACTITLTNAPSAGGMVLVLCSLFSGSNGTAFSCTASGGTGVSITKEVDTVGTSVNTIGLMAFTVSYTTAPTSLSIGNGGVGTFFMTARAINITGQNAVMVDVKSSTATTANDRSPVATSLPDLVDSTDLVFGWMTISAGGITITPNDANWPQFSEDDEANTIQTLSIISRTPGATGAFDPNWGTNSLNTADTWFAAGIAIKGTSGGGSGNVVAWLRA